MSIERLLNQIAAIQYLQIPSTIHSREDVGQVFGEGNITVEPDGYHVPCSHSFDSPANSVQIALVEKELGFAIPTQYRSFLEISDGAKLFVVPRTDWPNDPHVRYHLYGCDELVQINRKLLKSFKDYYVDDEEYKNCDRLNYIAFSYAEDGNYQAMLLNENDRQIFLLFHELLYRPYSDIDSDFYYAISDSFESWLLLIISSKGWKGRGELESGL